MNYRLSPSDLTFLYDGCKHCFVLRVKHGISQPSIPLPGIFSRIAALQKEFYSDRRTESICSGLPPGIVSYGEKQVRSQILSFPDCESTCYISGRFDIVAELDDRSFAVFDFKTGSPSEERGEMYGRQLHAYALALERPADGAMALQPITSLGLIYFTPDSCAHPNAQRQILEGNMQWLEVRRDDRAFMGFLEGVVRLLDGTMPPMNPTTCKWCEFRTRTGGGAAGPSVTDVAPGAVPGAPVCPVCNGLMRLRTGRHGDFWSCVNYPNCNGTRNA